MDSQAAAAGPWIALGVAAFALLAVLAAAAVLALRPSSSPDDSEPPSVGGFPDDDLPAFHEHPPGSRGAGAEAGRPAPPVALTARPSPPSASATGPGPRRLAPTARALLIMAAAALLLVLAAAGIELATRADAAPHAHSQRAGEPLLPLPPAAPAPGQPGAGALADASLPPGPDGVTVRLTFGGIALEQRASDVTATYPTVEVTTSGNRALAHLRLPTFDCPPPAAPTDPEAAGCTPGPIEFADLPTPALQVSRDQDTLSVTGRFAAYVRPEGSGPQYTGRVYDVAVTVRMGHADEEGRAPASGVLVLGTGRAESVDAPDVNVVQLGH